jgi:hypothetical protein
LEIRGNRDRIAPGLDPPGPGLVDVRDAQLGRVQTLERDGPNVSLIMAEGRCQQARMATIHAQVVVMDGAFPAAAPDRRAPIVGLLQWGQGGATFKADIDLRTGVCASLVASTVSLQARFEANDDPAADQRAFRVQVAGAVVWGTRPGRARTTRTLPRAVLAIAASGTFEVPPFASTVTIYTPIAAFYAAASTSVITLHGGPTITDDPELIITAGALGVQPLVFDGLLLAGATRFVTVQNLTGALLPLRLTFGLEL